MTVRQNSRFLSIFLLVLACPVPSLAREFPARPAGAPPNFIVILCDNLGYGDIEPFGSRIHRTPCLTRMAIEGRRFTHFYVSAGVCTPSRASLMTGCYAQRIGMHDNPRDGQVLRPLSRYGLNPDEVTIAEILKGAGYATGIFGKWHLGDAPVFLPTRQGFDQFFGIPYSDDMTADTGRRLGVRYDGEHWPPLPLMENEEVIEAPVDRDLLTKRLTQRAISFVEANRDRPFFLYLPQAMPGSTAAPFSSADFRGKSANGPWGDAIEELDWSTGQILDKLVELGIDRHTLVIWTSDNGAPLAKNAEELSRGSNLPLHGRGYTTGEGAFRAPTIFWWPGTIPSASTCDQLATTMDLLPTLAALADVKLDESRVIDGLDIRPLILGEQDAMTPHEAFFYYERDQLQAVRSGRWKLFVPLQAFDRHPHFKPGHSSDPLLFDVVNDVGCRANVAGQHPDVIAHLTQLAEQARIELGDRGRPGRQIRPRGEVH